MEEFAIIFLRDFVCMDKVHKTCDNWCIARNIMRIISIRRVVDCTPHSAGARSLVCAFSWSELIELKLKSNCLLWLNLILLV